ncbi:hypothetical protein KP509_20G068500 [Ceratopteris richardii]|uniref:Uncharacterized protein n=1 Tax=Ceratopteris richardii TaxID=49495 RepID=A0A8T2SG23_CERRI|nr:hypothetical protein KP509_20G068500 [Ceratopteris richardii]
MAGLIFVLLLMAVCSPRGETIRDVGLREVSEVALEEQEQVIRLQGDMEAAKRHLLCATHTTITGLGLRASTKIVGWNAECIYGVPDSIQR